MKQKNLVIVAGIPGSGKSTWIEQSLGENDVHISRDAIRFSLLEEGEDYFAHETQTFDKFVSAINENLNAGKRVFADATHINWASRRKLLERIRDKENIDIDVYTFATPLEVCLERNEQREGRARVPKSVVKRMFFQSNEPFNDPFHYNTIKRIWPDGREEDLTRWELR